MSEEWISSAELLKRLGYVMSDQANRQVISYLEHGLIKVKAQSAKVTYRFKEAKHADYLVPEDFFTEPGACSVISLYSDKLEGKIGQILDGGAKIEALILHFEVSAVERLRTPQEEDSQTENSTGLAPLSDAMLKAWWDNLKSHRHKLSEQNCIALVAQAFPERHVSRQRIRELRGSQKAGPKPKE